jgi:hypothetical protein
VAVILSDQQSAKKRHRNRRTQANQRLIRKNGIQSGCVQMVGKHEAMAVLQSSNDVL